MTPITTTYTQKDCWQSSTVEYQLDRHGRILRRVAYDKDGRVTTMLVYNEGRYEEHVFAPEED